jgi:Protein of unknown function (DUF3102)
MSALPATIEKSAIAEQIDRAYELALMCATDAVKHAIECGRLLSEQKRRCKHGDFQNWVKANCCITHDNANIFMRAYRQKTSGLVFSSLRESIELARKGKGGRVKFICQELNHPDDDFELPEGHSADDWAYMCATAKLLRSIERHLKQVDPATVARGIARHKELQTIDLDAHRIHRLIVALREALPSRFGALPIDRWKVEPEQEATARPNVDVDLMEMEPMETVVPSE